MGHLVALDLMMVKLIGLHHHHLVIKMKTEIDLQRQVEFLKIVRSREDDLLKLRLLRCISEDEEFKKRMVVELGVKEYERD